MTISTIIAALYVMCLDADKISLRPDPPGVAAPSLLAFLFLVAPPVAPRAVPDVVAVDHDDRKLPCVCKFDRAAHGVAYRDLRAREIGRNPVGGRRFGT